MSNGSKNPLEITAVSPTDLARLLSNSLRQQITEDQILRVARAGNLLSADGTINLIHYTAFLAAETQHGTH